jgi:hypothetical protein
MIDELKTKNNSIKELRQKIRQSPNRTTILQLDEILSNIKDKKAFILLLDTFETEKEITRELLELLIDHSFEINADMIEYMENGMNLSKFITNFFDTKNIKSIIIIAVALGIVISVSSNDTLAEKFINIIIHEKEK